MCEYANLVGSLHEIDNFDARIRSKVSRFVVEHPHVEAAATGEHWQHVFEAKQICTHPHG